MLGGGGFLAILDQGRGWGQELRAFQRYWRSHLKRDFFPSPPPPLLDVFPCLLKFLSAISRQKTLQIALIVFHLPLDV